MKPESKKITILSEDILQIAGNDGEKKFELNRLCHDNRNPFLLHDKKPVLDITQDDLVGIFVSNSGHYCLSPEQALRFGVYFNLNLPCLIALMIKAEWERLIYMVAKYSDNALYNKGSILRDSDLLEKYDKEFEPDTGKFFTLIRDLVKNPKDTLSYGLVDFLIDDLLENKKFLAENSQAGKLYSEKDNNELILLSEAPETQKAEYQDLKIRWTEKEAELDEFLHHLEEKKRNNLNIEDMYFKNFRKSEIVKAALIFSIEKFHTAHAIMKEQQGLSYRTLLTIAKERLAMADVKKNEIRSLSARSQNYIDFGSFGVTDNFITEELKNKYIKAVNSLEKKIFQLCHPDKIRNKANLSSKIKKELEDLFLKTMSSRKGEKYSYSPDMLLYHVPDYDELQKIYFRLCKILNKNPEIFEVGNRLEFMIKTGIKVPALIEFLKSEIAKINIQLINLELIRDEYTNETRTQVYREALSNVSKHSDKLKGEIKELKKRLRILIYEMINELKNPN